MIQCKDVSIDYGKKRILENISFTAKAGEITVLLGKNGCGKTTLLRAVDGAIHCKGSMEIDGIESRTLSAAARATHIAMMPQMLHCPPITVRELVTFGRQPYTGFTGILSPSDLQTVESVLERTGLLSLAEKRLDCISGGERQKAYFAMLLSQDTPNLLLDEPASHLDASYSNHLIHFLQEEKKRGKTVLAVLHDMNRAVDIADSIIVLQSGGIVFAGSRDTFCADTVAEEIFGLKKFICTDTKDARKTKICYL